MRRILSTFLLIVMLAGCASHGTTGNATDPASDAIVYIGGHEVHFQGAYPWHDGMTVKDLIKAAGGLSEYADHSRIRVTHGDGTWDTFKYAPLLTGEAKGPVLRTGDKVYVLTPIG